VETAERLRKERPDVEIIPYGFNAPGPYGIKAVRQAEGEQFFRLSCGDGEFSLCIPGRHTVENAAGALALVAVMGEKYLGRPLTPKEWNEMARGVRSFRGSRRRSEILGEAGGVLFMDDYAHHPSAIKTTLKGLKEFYPRRRLVVDFMSHTYSRTAGLFDEFSESFGDADLVILHKIYGSAREKGGAGASVSGKKLYEAVKALHPLVYYTEEVAEAEPLCREILKPGDLFLTMGAGNNWTLGRRLYEERKKTEDHQ
jgi:UDP-N-acetylmuramate--alanine ligase